MATDTTSKPHDVEDDSRGSLKEEVVGFESTAAHDISSASYRKLVHRIDRRVRCPSTHVPLTPRLD